MLHLHDVEKLRLIPLCTHWAFFPFLPETNKKKDYYLIIIQDTGNDIENQLGNIEVIQFLTDFIPYQCFKGVICVSSKA